MMMKLMMCSQKIAIENLFLLGNLAWTSLCEATRNELLDVLLLLFEKVIRLFMGAKFFYTSVQFFFKPIYIWPQFKVQGFWSSVIYFNLEYYFPSLYWKTFFNEIICANSTYATSPYWMHVKLLHEFCHFCTIFTQ